MGEKIRDLTKVKIANESFVLELNEPLEIGRERQIHLQNDKFRFECSESEMLAMLCNIVKAEKVLKLTKEGKNEEVKWSSK